MACSEMDSYISFVGNTFKGQPAKYTEFLRLSEYFGFLPWMEGHSDDYAEAITKLQDLFKGHSDLMLGFGIVHPPSPFDERERRRRLRKPSELDQAHNYIKKLQTRFKDNEQVYQEFLKLLRMYWSGDRTITRLYLEVADLFKDHEDLVQEFTNFLPKF